MLVQLMQKIGYAVWQMQELESAAATYLVVRVKATKGIGRQKGEALLATAEKRTFGTLLRELESAGVVSGDIGTRLEAALEERNWLVHRSRRESRGILNSPEMYSALVSRLDLAANDTLQLLKELGIELEAYVRAQGVSETVIDAEADRIAKGWGLLS